MYSCVSGWLDLVNPSVSSLSSSTSEIHQTWIRLMQSWRAVGVFSAESRRIFPGWWLAVKASYNVPGRSGPTMSHKSERHLLGFVPHTIFDRKVIVSRSYSCPGLFPATRNRQRRNLSAHAACPLEPQWMNQSRHFGSTLSKNPNLPKIEIVWSPVWYEYKLTWNDMKWYEVIWIKGIMKT